MTILKIVTRSWVWVLLLFPLVLGSFAPKYFKDWVKETDRKGIVVYLRSVPESQIKEFRAEVKVKVPIKKIIPVLLDFRSYPKWIYATTGTYLIDSKNNKDYIYYTVVKCPEPVKDRDLVIKMTIEELSDNKCVIKTTTLPKFIGEKPNRIRVKDFYGTWELTKISDTETLIMNQCYTDPAGKVPDWLINMMISTGPYETLENLRDLLMGKGKK